MNLSISYPGRREKIPSGKIATRAALWILPIASLLLLLAACADSRVEKLLAQANEEWVKGRNHSAVELFKSVLEDAPSGPYAEEALFRIGEIYHFGLGDSAQAINYFQEVAQMTPQGPFAYPAQKYIAEIVEITFQDLEQAIIEYQKLINEFSHAGEQAEHQYRIASIYFKKHDYEQAMVELEILLEEYSESTWAEEALFRMTEILYTLRRCDESRETYSKFRVRYPGSAYTGEIEYIMASCLEDEGKLKLARARYKSLQGTYKYPALLKMKLEGIASRINKGGKSKRKIRRSLRMRLKMMKMKRRSLRLIFIVGLLKRMLIESLLSKLVEVCY